jgi:hypothetical protein
MEPIKVKTTTTKIKIAVSINENGEWSSAGSSKETEKESMDYTLEDLDGLVNCFWVEAELSYEPKIIQGEVIPAGRIDYGNQS